MLKIGPVSMHKVSHNTFIWSDVKKLFMKKMNYLGVGHLIIGKGGSDSGGVWEKAQMSKL